LIIDPEVLERSGDDTHLGSKETIMKAKKATKKAEKGKKLGSSKLPKTTLQRSAAAGPLMHGKIQ
jgi:hypothetical protein